MRISPLAARRTLGLLLIAAAIAATVLWGGSRLALRFGEPAAVHAPAPTSAAQPRSPEAMRLAQLTVEHITDGRLPAQVSDGTLRVPVVRIADGARVCADRLCVNIDTRRHILSLERER